MSCVDWLFCSVLISIIMECTRVELFKKCFSPNHVLWNRSLLLGGIRSWWNSGFTFLWHLDYCEFISLFIQNETWLVHQRLQLSGNASTATITVSILFCPVPSVAQSELCFRNSFARQVGDDDGHSSCNKVKRNSITWMQPVVCESFWMRLFFYTFLKLYELNPNL